MNDIDKLKKDAGIINEEAPSSIANFDAMVEDMRQLLAQGRKIHLSAVESHQSDRYKGQVFKYRLTSEHRWT